MFERKQEIRPFSLKSIITRFQKSYNYDPHKLRNAIPASEVWRFFIEDYKQKGRGWMDFEEKGEKGYLLSLMNGFHQIFDTSKELTVDFIKKLHLKATLQVKDTNYDDLTFMLFNTRKGEFRKIEASRFGFGLTTKNASLDGIKEFFIKIKKQKGPINLSLLNIRNDTLATEIYKVISKGYQIRLDSRGNCSARKMNELLNQTMKEMVSDYNVQIKKANEPEEKIRVIVTFIRDCVQLHPFTDANCRVFCMLLLNHLLIKNGLPLAILDDPNKFGMHSIDELTQTVIKGMYNTFYLLKHRKLFGVHTKTMLDTNATLLEKKYFAKVVSTEEHNRNQRNYSEEKLVAELSSFGKSRFLKRAGLFAAGTVIGVVGCGLPLGAAAAGTMCAAAIGVQIREMINDCRTSTFSIKINY